MKITTQQIMTWKPCGDYPEEIVRELIDDGKTPLQILNLDIPTEDKFWAVLRSDVIDNKGLRELACKFAESVLHIFEDSYPDDDRPRKAIEAARKFNAGEISAEELIDARDATAYAANIACADAYAAGRAADAAVHTAHAAAYATARAAVDTANAACAKEQEKQLKIVREYFEKK